jgi:hypothetical protein
MLLTHQLPPPLQALEELRASDRGNILERGSWEENLASKCRTRLAIRPHSSRAVLFYSQKPNGEEDKASLHGACPVLSKSKYAANLWVWNSKYRRVGMETFPVDSIHLLTESYCYCLQLLAKDLLGPH